MAGDHTAAADAGRVDHCALGIKVGRPDHHAYGGRKDNDATHKTPLIRRWLARHPHDILDLAFVDVAMQVAVWNCVGPYGAKKRPRLGRCWSSLPSSLRLCRLRCSSSSSRSLAG